MRCSPVRLFTLWFLIVWLSVFTGSTMAQAEGPELTALPALPPAPVVPEEAPQPVVEERWLAITVLVTAYSPLDKYTRDDENNPDRKTSRNKKTAYHPYGIAADPRVLPYGTRIVVPGYMEESYPQKAWEVDDTGSRMRDDWKRGVIHIDLRFKGIQAANQWRPEMRNIWVDMSGLSVRQKEILRRFQ